MATEPSPTDEATRFSDPCRTSPTANTPGILVSKESGARVVILNDQPTPFDPIADAVLRGAIGEVLPRICAP